MSNVKTSYEENGEWKSVPFDPEIHSPTEKNRTRKVGMKTKELIEMLQETDPEGEMYVSVGKSGAFDIEVLPFYYDGRLRLPVFDEIEMESWRGNPYTYRRIIGDEQATGGSHVMIRTKSHFGDDYVFDEAAEGYLFEYSFKNMHEHFLESRMKSIWEEVLEGLQFQIDYEDEKGHGKYLYGLKTKTTDEWIITKPEMTQEFIDSLDSEKFWDLVKERTSLDLFDSE